MNANDYIWIERWGRMLLSSPDYINRQQEMAAKDNAPIGAIHQDTYGDWITIDSVTNLHTRQYFEYRYADCRVEGFWND